MKLEINGPDGKRTYSTRVGASLISVGRGSTCDIPLPKDAAASDLHLRFNQFVGQWSVTDQFSDGGTFVNGEKVFNTDLKVGDEIRAGATTMRLVSLESSAVAERGAAHSGQFEFTSAPRPAAPTAPPPAPMPQRTSSFESVSGDALQWKEPAATAWPEIKPFPADKPATEELTPAEAVRILNKDAVAPPQNAVTGEAPAWAPTRRDTERLKMQTVVRDKNKARQPKPPPEPPPPPARPPAVYSGTPASVAPVPQAASRAAAPWEARQNTAIRNASAAPSAKKKGNFGGCIVALVIGAGIAIGIVSEMLESGNQNKPRPKANVVAPVNSWDGSPRKYDPTDKPPVKESAPKWDSARQKLVGARIKEIKDGLGTPSKKLDDLAALMEKHPADPPYPVSGSLERAQMLLKLDINMALSKRLGDDQRDIWQLTDVRRYDEALARLQSLKEESERTKWIAEQAEKLEVAKYIADKTASLVADNAEHIGKTLHSCDSLRSLGCNALAHKELDLLLACANFTPAVRQGLEIELEDLRKLAQATPGPEKAPRIARPKVPPPPRNSLLPDGSATQSALLSRLRTRLSKVVGEGKMPDAACKLYGRDARLMGLFQSRLQLAVDHPLAGGAPGFKLTYTIALHSLDLPPDTIAGLYAAMPDPSVEHWLAVMLFCFDSGLNDDAARAALKLDKLSPDARADLEAIMAAKLGIVPPEKGFVEKDGALVPG